MSSLNIQLLLRLLWSAVLLNLLQRICVHLQSLFRFCFVCKGFFIETKYLLLSEYMLSTGFGGSACAYIHTFCWFWWGCMCVYIYIHRGWLISAVYMLFFSCILLMFLSNSLIFEKFSNGDPDTKDNSVGIQLLGIVLANNLPPFDPKCEIDRVRWELQRFGEWFW